jgi:hypothetical protein
VYEIKQTIAHEQVSGVDSFPEDAVRDCAIEVTPDVIETTKSMFYSPDVDGCVENLHLNECISGHDQTDSLSYILLEAFREYLTMEVPGTGATETMFEAEQLPAATINDTHIFLEF